MICFKSRPPEVLYYKGFLQICNKITEKHPRENETQLNGRVMLLKGAFPLHPYITSSTKTFPWLQENVCLFCGSQYVSIGINEYAEQNIAKANKGIQKTN